MLFLTLLCALKATFTLGQSGSTNALLSPFALHDQHDQLHAVSFPQEKPVLLIVVDKKGSQSIESWTTPLSLAYSNAVTFVIVGDVSPIPAFLRARYKKNFQKTLPHPVLLDWRGEVAPKLQFARQVPNLFLVNPKGEIVFKTAGLADVQKIQEISAAINRLLPPGGEKFDSPSRQN